MRKLSTYFIAFLLLLTDLSFAQVMPGSTCDEAITLQCGVSYSVNTLGVPNDNVTSGASQCGAGTGGQIWFAYTPSTYGVLTVSTCGSQMDTRIHIFSGACGTLSCVAQNDDACGLQSTVTIEALAGESYLIRAGGFNSVSGAFTISANCGEMIAGCTDYWATNFNQLALVDDGSCFYAGCTDSSASNYNWMATTDDGSCIPWVMGCTNPTAVNYNSSANSDDGSCVVEGCTDATAQNFNTNATIDNGSCYYCNGEGSVMASLYLCTFANGNQVELQIVDDAGVEVYHASGLNSVAIIYADVCLQAGVCYTANMINNTGPLGWYNGYFWVNVAGTQVINAQPPANAQFSSVQFSIDGTCGPVFGCTDPGAVNFDAAANMENGTCVYPTLGCTDSSAVNFNALAGVDDGSCFFMNDCLGSIAEFALTPGTFASESSYVIYDQLGNTIAAGSGATSQFACLLDGCYTVAMYDSFGDGWDGSGFLEVIVNGVVANVLTLSYGFEGVAYFGINAQDCTPAVSGCTDPTATNYNALATEDNGTCVYPMNCTDNMVVIQVSTGNWGSEIGWSLVGADGVEYASGSGYSSWYWYEEYACVPSGCYELVLSDSWGDGWNGAYYWLSSGGAFYEGSLLYGSTSIDLIGVNSECGMVAGCMDAEALNYNPQATFDDGSCVHNNGGGLGLTNGLEMEFAMYPNPTNGGIIVNASSLDPLKVVTLNVFGTEGRLLRSTTHSSATGTLQVQEDLSQLPAGFYFVEMVNGTSRLVKSLVKQ